jgi:DNA-binding YbaB/EbfC family protein
MAFNPSKLQELMAEAQRRYQELQQKMEQTVVEASAGGGSVTVRMNGQKRVVKLTIDPEVLRSGDLEMLQDLVTAAMNEASRKVDQEVQSTVGGMLGGIPGLSNFGIG